ncbi:MAG: tRNA epoxyqueuosine(34) reductase QueG [Prevotellaceae bacterium]|nr:tRNA epoxyqueuosine(34) reductase QueG [Prevotellaceae bacterium]
MSSGFFSSEELKAEARSLGFSHCGVCPVEEVPAEVRQLFLKWLQEGRHAGMSYLERHAEERFSPSLLVPGTKAIISLAISYNPGLLPTQKALAWYAQGADYHTVVREKLQKLMKSLRLEGRAFTDTAPVLEKYWAWRCGLGFIGRHTQLVIPSFGSAYFLGEIFVNQLCDRYDSPINPSFLGDECGSCRLCEEACPTGAIANRCLDARKCLGYLTIEHRGDLPEWTGMYLKKCFYGCDRCLRACPHLCAEKVQIPEEFRAKDCLLRMTESEWRTLSREKYEQLFQGSAVKRAKYEGLRRNILAAFN